MSLARRQPAAPTPGASAPAVLRESPGNVTAPVGATPEDWDRTVEVLLKATVWHRNGVNAARHAEIRRRMRALAGAVRSFGRET